MTANLINSSCFPAVFSSIIICFSPSALRHQRHGGSSTLGQMLLKGYAVHLRSLCRKNGDDYDLQDFVNISNSVLAGVVQEMICRTPDDWLDQIEARFIQNLDFFKPFRVSILAT